MPRTHLYWILPSLLSAATTADLSAQVDHLYGAYPDTSVVEGFRDANNDGYDDFLVGGGTTAYSREKVVLVSGLTMMPLRSWKGSTPSEGFGSSISLGDLNNDGTKDIIVGSPWYTVTSPKTISRAGRVTAIDGKTFAVMFTIDGQTANEYFGTVARAREYHGRNGRPELFVSGTGYQSNTGIVRVFDIVGTTTLSAKFWRQWAGTTGAHRFGTSIECGDVTGDKVPDILIGAYGRAGPGCRNYGSGRVQVIDGLFLNLYPAVVGPNHGFSTSMVFLPDTNGNGLNEFVVGSPLASRVYHYDGSKTGKFTLIRSFGSSLNRFTYLGIDMKVIPDQDNDRKPDILVGGSGTICSITQIKGSAEIFSLGTTVKSVQRIDGPYDGSRFGTKVAYGGDINGDGTNDLLVVNNSRDAQTQVISRKPLRFSPRTSSIALGSTGSVPFRINAGKANAGNVYVIAGSMKGVKPGIPLPPNFVLPLNPGIFMGLQLSFLNLAPFVNFLGRLDGNGKGTGNWTMFPGVPAALRMVPMHYSYAIIDISKLSFTQTGNFIPFYVR